MKSEVKDQSQAVGIFSNAEVTDLDCFYLEIEEDRNLLSAFTSALLSRQEWAKLLGVHRDTIRNWELEVLNKVRSMKQEYWLEERTRANCLDAYQRFLIAYIRKLKMQHGVDYRAVRLTLIKNVGQLKRNQFESWRESNELK